MDERTINLNKFYGENCDEDTRLASRHGSIEFITTTKYIDALLKPGDRILEIGAGTGRYSLHYANKGFKVNAIEFVEHNVNVLKSKITSNMDIVAEQGDALDLSRFSDNTFDVTLVLGPLYHLYEEKNIDKAINEAIRVTKKDGIIALAYLTSDSIMVNWALMKNHLIDGYPDDFDSNFKMVNHPGGIFSAFYISEFKKIMSKYNVDLLKNIATDGLSHHFKDKIDSLTDEEFKIWVKYHLSTCEREELQGYSNHMLYICKKKI